MRMSGHVTLVVITTTMRHTRYHLIQSQVTPFEGQLPGQFDLTLNLPIRCYIIVCQHSSPCNVHQVAYTLG